MSIRSFLHRQGYDLQLTQYDERGGRATFYTAGLEHSPTSSTGTGWEQTPLRARKLYVVVPKLTTDNSDDGVLMDDSVYPQMVAQIRRAQKERLELWLPWIPLITALTALTARRH